MQENMTAPVNSVVMWWQPDRNPERERETSEEAVSTRGTRDLQELYTHCLGEGTRNVENANTTGAVSSITAWWTCELFLVLSPLLH